jgi:hypothetical protein
MAACLAGHMQQVYQCSSATGLQTMACAPTLQCRRSKLLWRAVHYPSAPRMLRYRHLKYPHTKPPLHITESIPRSCNATMMVATMGAVCMHAARFFQVLPSAAARRWQYYKSRKEGIPSPVVATRHRCCHNMVIVHAAFPAATHSYLC